jgi:hypothetical protein
MATSAGFWYVPRRVSCLDVDRETRDELRSIARGRVVVIDYFAYAARGGLRFGDVRFRWLDEGAHMPDRLLRLADIDEPPMFIKAELAPLMISEQARLTMSGPRWLGLLRHPTIVITDGGPWLTFFDAHATPLGLRR